MASDAENLAGTLLSNMPAIKACWRGYLVKGYDARMAGKSRNIHARSSHKSFYQQGWDKADAELAAATAGAET